MSAIFHLPPDILEEFSIDSQGKASASQRGTARLAGVSQPAIRKLLLKLSDNLDVPEIFKSFAGYSFKGDNLDDVLVALIIEYYAFEAGRYCTKQAKLVFRAFGNCSITAGGDRDPKRSGCFKESLSALIAE